MSVRSLVGRIVPAELRRGAPLRCALVEARREVSVALATRRSAKRLRALTEAAADVKLHLGAGQDPREGWVNIDLPPAGPGVVGYDLRVGLPMATGSVEIVYSSHFFEHLDYGDALRLIDDCHRVLRPGGTFRACLPDFTRAFERYVAGDDAYFDLLPQQSAHPLLTEGTATRIDWINRAVFENGAHQYCWDAEKMILVLGLAGFRDARETEVSDLDPHDPQRERYSFYVEATA